MGGIHTILILANKHQVDQFRMHVIPTKISNSRDALIAMYYPSPLNPKNTILLLVLHTHKGSHDF